MVGFRSKRNIHRVKYCEIDNPFLDQQLSYSLETSTDTAVPIHFDQDRIGWDHFVRGRISLDFSQIVDSYYRSNKLERWFTSQNGLLW